jgi:nitrogen fixation/metabolism regulation signal transduction histidine kinase
MSNYLQSILKSINNTIMTFDNEGRLLTSNKPLEPLFGLQESQMNTKSYHSWLGPNTKLKEDIEKVYSTHCEVTCPDYELIKIRAGGSNSTLNIKYTALPLTDSKVEVSLVHSYLMGPFPREATWELCW